MLKSKTINRRQAFVNIINKGQTFEKHARRLFVSTEPLCTTEMEKKSVVTKSGRKATAVSIIRKCRGQMNPDKEAAGITKSSKNVLVRDDSDRRNRGVKSTVELEKSLLKINKDVANLRNHTSTIESTNNKTKKKAIKSRITTRKSNNKEMAKKAVNFADTSTLNLNSTSVISNKRLRKPNLMYVQVSVSETPKKVPIYKKNADDSDNENIKTNKDIYKFTEEFIDKSDVNTYDKETAEIMTRIEKAEKRKAKNTSKTNKRNKTKNFIKPKNKKPPSTVDVEIIFNSSNIKKAENIKTYSTKCCKTIKEVDRVEILADRVEILADIVVHASLNSHEANLAKELATKKESLSTFDKLKSNSKLDEIREMNQLDSPAILTIRNTSPLLDNIENTADDDLISQIDVNYDHSNSFGFDEMEVISPENSTLIRLNEVSRKLQKKTPWRNLLIVKNKRILTVKPSSLPNVDQELILDSTIVQKLSSTLTKPTEVKQSKNQVQTKLYNYIEGITIDKSANLSTLFDSDNLSPIKPIECTKKITIQSPVKTSLISTPRRSFKRNILHLNPQNQQNIVESEDLNPDHIVSINSSVENHAQLDESIDNSYFGFVSPVVKMRSKENVLLTCENEKSPRKLPTRIDPLELKRFKRKYVNKKRRPVDEQKGLDSSFNESVGEKDVSDELSALGLFDELLEAEEEPSTKKRNRKEDDERTDKICRNRKRRHKNEMSEFNKWAKKFNKMCKEVEKHELSVE